MWQVACLLRLSGHRGRLMRVGEVHPSLPRPLWLSPRFAVAGSVPVGSGSLQ